jgi:uncharacterized protein (DUF302 family)
VAAAWDLTRRRRWAFANSEVNNRSIARRLARHNLPPPVGIATTPPASAASARFGNRMRKEIVMSYTINRTIKGSDFAKVEERVRKSLQDSGFGVLTEIDVKATMKKKLDVTLEPYLILGACNPKMAYRAIEMEPRVGAMLPCNVILRQLGEDVEISAIDPVASMAAIDNVELKRLASQVRDMLESAVEAA